MFHQTGAPKKKLLTDPVSIIPFPNQDLRDKAPKATVTKPAVKAPIKKVFDRPEPKVLSAPSGNKKYAASLSINKMMAPKKEGEDGAPMDLSNMPMNDYHIDDFKMACADKDKDGKLSYKEFEVGKTITRNSSTGTT